eukprot:TRINITY_DN62851_c0_g1_i1.p1 TRINITY_DN62851_c0_g1~~TRINITY_DN62851_c0_g1_i1.p1  ORF type:complete len:443 (+),score=124.99 TRINITY_DN62851_c0_g1_i1:42-1370(+)
MGGVCPHRHSRARVAAAGPWSQPPSPAAQVVQERRALFAEAEEEDEEEEGDDEASVCKQLWGSDNMAKGPEESDASSALPESEDSEAASESERHGHGKVRSLRQLREEHLRQKAKLLAPPPTGRVPKGRRLSCPSSPPEDMDAWHRAKSLGEAESCLASASASVTKLALIGIQTSDEDVARLASLLRGNTGVLRLCLDQCHITDLGAEELAEALRENDSLTGLSLEGNRVGDRGAGRLAAALQQNEALTSLSLGRNRVGSHGLQQLADALEVNYTLKTLDLTSNSGHAGWSLAGDSRASAHKRVQALLQRNRAPRKVVTLRALRLPEPPDSPPSSPEAAAAGAHGLSGCAAQLRVSCTNMAGVELAELVLDSCSDVRAMREELAARLEKPKPMLALLLPEGHLLQKADDRRQLLDVFFPASGYCSAAEDEAEWEKQEDWAPD